MNGALVTKLSSCHFGSFMVRSKTYSKSCRGFTFCYSTFMKMCKQAAFSKKAIVIGKIGQNIQEWSK